MNSASSGNEGIIFLTTQASDFRDIDWVCSISSFELTRQ